MALLDLFRPPIQHSNPKVRRAKPRLEDPSKAAAAPARRLGGWRRIGLLLFAAAVGLAAPAFATIWVNLRVAVADSETPVYFSCDGSWESRGHAVTCRWDFGDGSSAQGVNVQHRYRSPGTYTARLTACSPGSTSTCETKTQAFNLFPPCTPVVDPRGPYSGSVGESMLFEARGAGCNNAHYVWDFGDGSVHDGRNTHDRGREHGHSYSQAGTFTVRLQVFIADVLKGTAFTTSTIRPSDPPPNVPPVAAPGGPYFGCACGRPIAFDGSRSSDPEGAPLSYHWTFGDGDAGSSGPVASHAYRRPGLYELSLVVNDGRNSSSPATTTVAVSGVEASPTYIGSGGLPSDGWFMTANLKRNGDPVYYEGAELVKYDPGTGYATVWLSTGNGSFEAGPSVYIGSGGSRLDWWLTTADVSGDGLADLVKYDPGTGYVTTWLSVWRSTGMLFEEGPSAYLGSGGSPANHWFTTADRGARADLVKYDPGTGYVTTWLSRGTWWSTGTWFEAGPSVYIGSGGSPSDRWFTTADVGGDLREDLVKFDPGSGYVTTWLATGTSFVEGPSVYIGSGGSPADRWFTTARMNLGGRTNLVKYDPGSGYATTWLSTGTSFVEGPSAYLGSGGSPADHWFTTADVNFDGRDDLIKYDPAGCNGVWLSPESGTSFYATSTYIGTGGSPADRWFTVADVDADGGADLVMYEPGTGFVSTWPAVDMCPSW